VKRGEPMPLTWNAPTMPDLARVQIRLDISHHGGKKGEIDCDAPDNGAFEIPASLVTDLVDLGLAGFPTVQVAREIASSSEAEPKIALLVSSPVEREVDTGVHSCTMDMDCPAGQHCDTGSLVCK
jgi:Cys-rich repeat protein